MNIVGFNIVVNSRVEPHLPTTNGHSKQLYEDMSEACCGPYIHMYIFSFSQLQPHLFGDGVQKKKKNPEDTVNDKLSYIKLSLHNF